MKIVPAILTDNREEFLEMLKVCQRFTDYIQIDIMDGVFVPSCSITKDDFREVNIPIRSEVHLMVKEPIGWLDSFIDKNIEKVIYHFEIDGNHKETIDRIRRAGFKVGIAVNPSTSLDEFINIIDEVDSVLFMSVNPGFYGSKFIPHVLEKIKLFKQKFPYVNAGIDGGVKFDNIKQVVATGVDYVCVGSAIMKAKAPDEAFYSFQKLVNRK